jgi:hypothetical protein
VFDRSQILDPEIGYPDRGFIPFSVLLGQCCDSSLKQAAAVFFQILLNPPFMIIINSWHCITCIVEKVLLNKFTMDSVQHNFSVMNCVISFRERQSSSGCMRCVKHGAAENGSWNKFHFPNECFFSLFQFLIVCIQHHKYFLYVLKGCSQCNNRRRWCYLLRHAWI